MKTFEIRINGSGTKEEIVNALRSVIADITNPDLEINMETSLRQVWEGETLLTEFSEQEQQVYYQPSFKDKTPEDLFSFQVFLDKSVAQKAFPDFEILEYSGGDIEDYEIVDHLYK